VAAVDSFFSPLFLRFGDELKEELDDDDELDVDTDGSGEARFPDPILRGKFNRARDPRILYAASS
jgi:hypothetical protein